MLIDFALGFALAGWIVAVVVYVRQGEQLRRIEALEAFRAQFDETIVEPTDDIYEPTDEDDDWLGCDCAPGMCPHDWNDDQ
jgi:hypothetical protein